MGKLTISMAIFHMLTGPGDQSLRYQPDENICPYAAGRHLGGPFLGGPQLVKIGRFLAS